MHEYFVALGIGTFRNWNTLNSLAVAPNGDIYANSGSALYKYDVEENDFISQTGVGEPCLYSSVAVAPNGDVYVCLMNIFGAWPSDIYKQTGGTGNFVALGQTTRNWYVLAASPDGDIYAIAYIVGDYAVYKQTEGAGDFVEIELGTDKCTNLAFTTKGECYALIIVPVEASYQRHIMKYDFIEEEFVAINTDRNYAGIAADDQVYVLEFDGDMYKRIWSQEDTFTLTDEITFGGAGKGTQYFRTFSDVFTLNDASSIDATLNLYKIVIGYDRKMIMNSSQQLTAIGYYNYEEDRDLTREVTWRSSNPSVATIDADGLLSSYSYGITFITATLGLMSTTVMLQNEDVTATLPVISSLQQIPIDSSPNQTFSTTLKVDGKNITLGFFLRWNEQAGYWAMTIYNYLTGRYYVDSLPLLKGTLPSINLLQMYSYLRIGSCYLINISGSKDDYPTVSNLGKDFLLLWGDTEV